MDGLWDRVDALVDRAPRIEALRLHRLHLYAARRWRDEGRTVPADLLADANLAAAMALAAPIVLRTARAAIDGRLLLMKGPEVAARYPSASDRGFRDLDLLTDDPDGAQQALLDAGFVQLYDPEAPQHLAPLIWPGLPLVLELHRYPHLPSWLPPVSPSQVFDGSVPSITGVPGLLAPAPDVHALLLAAHSWAHQPLGRLGDLIDVATMSPSDPSATRALAAAWGWERFWSVTDRVISAVLRGGPGTPGWTRLWSRHLWQARDRTVLEHHIARLAAPVCAPPTNAPRALLEQVRRTTSPRPDERWQQKLARTRQAVVHAFMEKSGHEVRVDATPARRCPITGERLD